MKLRCDATFLLGNFQLSLWFCVIQKTSAQNVFVLCLFFVHSLPGQFSGFDENEPTSESGGKMRVVKLLKAKYGYKK